MAEIGWSGVLKKGSTTVADVKDFTLPGMTRGAVKTTALGQAENIHTFIPGMRMAGDAQFTVYYTASTLATVRGYANAASDTWHMVHDAYDVSFDGFVTDVSDAPFTTDDEAIVFSVTIKCTTDLTATPVV